MLINRVGDDIEDGDRDDGQRQGEEEAQEFHTNEYQTASDLFDFMSRDYNFGTNDSLTMDLVLLYKNLDLGTQLISNVKDFNVRKPNQRVETVVYNGGESEGSDMSDYEDIHNVVLINKNRIDLLTRETSYTNSLCEKFGDLQIQSPGLPVHYDKNFLLKDAIKDQLQSLTLLSNSVNNQDTLPSSLFEYICCKRLEDNYNFYMDNVIRYVKHTIEQLKRISNGDYLTEKAKKKWREVEDYYVSNNEDKSLKILAKSASIPLHVERKVTGNKITWDDIVHSEVDLRSLSKVLEKRIVLEIPKLICGSYKLFSKRYSDNLIISCKREIKSSNCEEQPRVDVFMKLKRSDSGYLVNNISSIMILENTSQNSLQIAKVLPLSYKKDRLEDIEDRKSNVIEIIEESAVDNGLNKLDVLDIIKDSADENRNVNEDFFSADLEEKSDNTDLIKKYIKPLETDSNSNITKHILNDNLKSNLDNKYNTIIQDMLINNWPTDDLGVTMNNLNITTLPEESNEDVTSISLKKKKPSFVRVKSPYENKTHKIDDKKRRKLLEIRDRREKKKLAMSETCKVTKHKYTRGSVLPQASNSVTKLSITNKSFYNSIYGSPSTLDNKPIKYKWRKDENRDLIIDIPIEKYEDSSVLTPDNDCKKYINRSYYLDDTVSEMMYIEMNKDNIKVQGDEELSVSTSALSNESHHNLNILSQFITPSVTVTDNFPAIEPSITFKKMADKNNNDPQHCQASLEYEGKKVEFVNVPSNTPKDKTCNNKDNFKTSVATVECRKSIEKVYSLINKNNKCEAIDNTVKKMFKTRSVSKMSHTGSLVQGSESGTSFKHQLMSPNPSNFSFSDLKSSELLTNHLKTSSLKGDRTRTSVEPKVIINTKQSTSKSEDRSKRDRRRLNINQTARISDNPLKAISQLLQEFDNVQKYRQKSESKPNKKQEYFAPNSKSNINQDSNKKHARFYAPQKFFELPSERHSKTLSKSKKSKLGSKNIQGDEDNKLGKKDISNLLDEATGDNKLPKKKISDILDEAKEARGEAVRGPPRGSRLHSLAQPKKSYVLAHSEEFQNKYGRNVMSDRLQRLASYNASRSTPERSTILTNLRHKVKKSDPEATVVVAKEPCSSPSPSGRLKVEGYSQASQGKTHKTPILTTKGQSFNQNNGVEALEPGKKFLDVKWNFEKTCAPKLNESSVCNSTVPLFPKDMELDSIASTPTAEESNTLGIKLHQIINNVLVSKNLTSSLDSHLPSNSLSVIKKNEYNETTTMVALESKKETTLENNNYKVQNNIFNTESHNIAALIPTGEMMELENALYRQMSTGTIQKRLRIKNLTLTPKHSMQQVVVFHSGDTGSAVLQRTFSNLKISSSKSVEISNIENLSVLSKSNVDWTFTNIPMQIATVGYALPTLHTLPNFKQVHNISGKTEELKTCEKDLKRKKHEHFSQQYSCRSNYADIVINTTNKISPKITLSNSNEKITELHSANDIRNFDNIPKTGNTSIKTSDLKLKPKPVVKGELDFDKIKKSIEPTSSLDMLVGLLNEIQKITTCQTHMATKYINPISQEAHKNQLKLDAIKTDFPFFDKRSATASKDLISITSLDNLRQLESNPSLYSFYISNNSIYNFEEKETQVHDLTVPIKKHYNIICCADKEIGVNLTNSITLNANMFEQKIPIKENRSTTMSTSLLRIISNPSFHSLYSFTEQIINPIVKVYSEGKTTVFTKEVDDLPPTQLSIEPLKRCSEDLKKPSYNDTEILSSVENAKRKKERESRTKLIALENKISTDKYNVNEFNPVLKMKRDILVMTYSILVLIVFAAMSLPDLMYRL